MIYDGEIRGRYVKLRSIQPEDAEYSMRIRQDAEKNKFLHQVSTDVDHQRAWIEAQQKREGDYFFIVSTLDGKKNLGTVGVYDIQGQEGHLGRLLMFGNPFQTFEACILAMQFAYYTLGLEAMHGDVHVDNTASLSLSEALGFHFGEPIYDADLDRYFRWGTGTRSEYPQYEEKIKQMIYRD